MITKFKILNWNIGGAKFLKEKEDKRSETREQLNIELKELIRKHKPQVVTLQEIVQYGESSQDFNDIIDKDKIGNYQYYPFRLIDSDRLSSKAKWNIIRDEGDWDPKTFFAQGNAFLFHNDLQHFPVWDLPAYSTPKFEREGHFIEQVNLESGLYFGDRNTEPRAALVAHFAFSPKGKEGKPLDIFVINLHLTTLMMEREGIPGIDLEASRIRLAQLGIIFRGIVSRYNRWKRQEFKERGKDRVMEDWETIKREEPVWILAGDFNFTPESEEYETIMRMNFIDVVPNKGHGTKAKGPGNPPTLTVDYIFAGPKFISLDPVITEEGIKSNSVDAEVPGSDHYPMVAKIPIKIPEDAEGEE